MPPTGAEEGLRTLTTSHFLLHPEWNAETVQNDIAIIFTNLDFIVQNGKSRATTLLWASMRNTVLSSAFKLFQLTDLKKNVWTWSFLGAQLHLR